MHFLIKRMKPIKFFAIGFILALIISSRALGDNGPKQAEGVIKKSAEWSGTVLVTGDVLVPDGVTLKIDPGTKVLFVSSESSKIEPLYLSMQTELLVRGKLLAKGTEKEPITFGSAGQDEDGNRIKPKKGCWAGLIFDGPDSSDSIVSHASIGFADSAITTINSSPVFNFCDLTGGNYGVVCLGESWPMVYSCDITGNDFGVLSGKGAEAGIDHTKVENNKVNFITRL